MMLFSNYSGLLAACGGLLILLVAWIDARGVKKGVDLHSYSQLFIALERAASD